ncbi:MAG TPA: hypothetical protein VD887_13100 [Allosphingosinicella sp.]|nr:hypothetical protein [Allosphingosinicella sp.]
MRGRHSGGAASTTGWRVSFVAALIAAPALAYFIVRTAAAGTVPALGASLPPADVSALLRPMVFSVADPRRRVPPAALAAARTGARTTPLAFEPFFIVARAEEQAGRLPRAIALLEEARRRRPNQLLIHIQLLAYYQAARRERDLLAELDFVLRRSNPAKQFVYPELARMAARPRDRRTLAAVLASNPSWRRDFLGAARQQIAPGDVAALIEEMRRQRPGVDVAPERSLYVQALARTGDFRRARALWLEALPASDRARHALLFDGRFREARSEPPFGWTYAGTDSGRAERSHAGGQPYLDISYFGGSDVVLAEQVLTLGPGRYRLRTRAKSDGSPVTSGAVLWNLTCAAGDASLVRLPLAGLRESYRDLETLFQVPGSCPAQRLRLIGAAGDVAATIQMQVAAVEVVGAD